MESKSYIEGFKVHGLLGEGILFLVYIWEAVINSFMLLRFIFLEIQDKTPFKQEV